MICTLLYMGIRISELCALKWNEFTEDSKSVIIDESLTDTYYENDTKTEYTDRIIPLGEGLSNAFKWLSILIRPDDEEYVFTTSRGGSYYSILIDKRFSYVRQCAAKKYNNPNLLTITPHYFRHTFASRAIHESVHIKDLQELLGHSTSRTTMDVYVHGSSNNKRKTISDIEDSIGYKIKNNNGDMSELMNHKHRRYSSIKWVV